MDEVISLLARYYQDKWNWVPDDLQAWPRHQRVWEWWHSLAHYQLQRHYQRLEDAPAAEDGTWISVMGADVKTMYKREHGKWVRIQEIKLEEMRSLYGN